LTDAKLIADTKAAYGWTEAPFGIPAAVKARWESFGVRGAATRTAETADAACVAAVTVPGGGATATAKEYGLCAR
jgi:transketolase